MPALQVNIETNRFGMVEANGIDLWNFHGALNSIICITTNGSITRTGHAVCGAGCNGEAERRYSDWPRDLGRHIRNIGNIPFFDNQHYLLSFPVKKEWHHKADLDLIGRSMALVVEYRDLYQWEKVYIPRPGCGYGQRNWNDVCEILTENLPQGSAREQYVFVHQEGHK